MSLLLKHHLPVVAVTVASLTLATPALAHVTVEKTSPKKSATVKGPAAASVTFSGPIKKGTLKVVGPGKRVVSVGTGARDPRNVTRVLVELRSSLKSGTYKATWKITAGDGHKESGSFTFKVKR